MPDSRLGQSDMCPHWLSDIGLRATLEALQDIALRPDATLEHKPSGVTLRLENSEQRLSVIVSALGPAIRELRERWPDA